jgi:N-acetylglucosamine-6-phosphate deacetylase
MEGPFISKEKKGAHPEQYIRELRGFDDIMEMYGSLDNVSIVTLAPEHPGSDQVIRECVKRGVTVSLGLSVFSLKTILFFFFGDKLLKAVGSSVDYHFCTFSTLTPKL